MLFTTHALVGATIGNITNNPLVAVILGIISHHLLDYIPHYDPGSFYYGKKSPNNLTPQQLYMAVIDVSMGIGYLAMIVVVINHNTNLLWGALGGVLPDLVDNTPVAKDIFRKFWFGNKYHNFHEKFHTTMPWQKALAGLGGQLLIMLICLWYFVGRGLK